MQSFSFEAPSVSVVTAAVKSFPDVGEEKSDKPMKGLPEDLAASQWIKSHCFTAVVQAPDWHSLRSCGKPSKMLR